MLEIRDFDASSCSYCNPTFYHTHPMQNKISTYPKTEPKQDLKKIDKINDIHVFQKPKIDSISRAYPINKYTDR